jgi:hypothetical protein
MSYAQAADVATRLGRQLTTEEASLVETRLTDVERLILRRIPDLAAKITAETVDVDDVRQVEAEAVLRLVRNPEGYVSEGDGTYQYVRDQSLASGRLEILPEEWEILGLIQSRMSVLVPGFGV